ncbi:polysaccharide biosynthesis tyrosine autokinase [Actinoplanes sp. NPDC024001]|uniref:polysaccharide biosynthesis tyrosine autokinase n=1 Tax=Actinoplanes sp. NPDC024001 TaxID=3154598 RepID=UPI0033F8231A
MTAATVAAAYGVNQSLPQEYRSEATVLVEAHIAADTTPILPDLETERALALSDAVVLPASQRVGVSRSAMLDGLEIEIVPGADVLTFVYAADNRFSAQVRARALVEAYLDVRRSGTLTSPTVITPATLPSEADTRPLAPDLAAGLAAGLLLGTGTALLRAQTRGRIRSREDFARLTGSTVLATVPRTRRPAGTATGLPVVLRAPGSPAAEAYRYLRTRLQPVLRPTSATTILVTSPTDRDGRTTVAANLAVALAQAGRSVVLIDADLRRPALHNVFQIPGDYGLTTLLDGDATVSEVLEDTSVPRLRLLPAGHRTGEHVDLLESPQLARVLRAVQKHCDVVVIDSAAVLSASDAIALAALSDRVVLVGDFRHTTRQAVRRATAELAEVVDDNLSAVLLNLPKAAGGLAPRTRELSTANPTPFAYGRPNARLKADAEDVAPPGMTSHVYVEADDEAPAEEPSQDQPRVVIPVIYGAPSSTVYSSASAALEEPTAMQRVIDEPTAVQRVLDEPSPTADAAAEPSPIADAAAESAPAADAAPEPAPAADIAPEPAPATDTAPEPAPATDTAPESAPAADAAPEPAPTADAAPESAPAADAAPAFADAVSSDLDLIAPDLEPAGPASSTLDLEASGSESSSPHLDAAEPTSTPAEVEALRSEPTSPDHESAESDLASPAPEAEGSGPTSADTEASRSETTPADIEASRSEATPADFEASGADPLAEDFEAPRSDTPSPAPAPSTSGDDEETPAKEHEVVEARG